eukprot:5240863-Amphidinium_carterae.1
MRHGVHHDLNENGNWRLSFSAEVTVTFLIVYFYGVWHEARVHAEFGVGELCVRCGELLRIWTFVHHCPAWFGERREVALPASALEAPPCVRLHGLLLSVRWSSIMSWFWFPGLASTLYGLMGQAVALAPHFGR